MKKYIFGFICIASLIKAEVGDRGCFLAIENNKILSQEGECQLRHAPRCSFNIAISLMGFDEGLLVDETCPEFQFKEGYFDYIEKWKQSHNPYLWMKNSCLWYSQVLIQKLGAKKFQEYVRKFNYGNQDVSGDKGKNNGLTRSWMSGSSLEISPEEQAVFLQKFLDQKFPVSSESYEMTKNIIFVDDLVDGWKRYGKTGLGNAPNADGTLNEDREEGWFVGWAEKGKRAIICVCYIEQDRQDISASGLAKEIAKEKLMKLIEVR